MSGLLNDSTSSKFVTIKCIKVNDLQNEQYSVNKNIRFKNPMLRSNLSNYSDVYIVIKRIITAESNNANNRTDKMLIFKNNNSFRSFISKVNNTFINNRDLDIVRSMSNLLEYSDNYSMT